MVLDVKFMDWAGSQGLDTAKLRTAKIAVYGKWYFPTIPAGRPLVNLRTGEVQVFSQEMQAGETLWAAQDDLTRAKFWPPRSAEEIAAEKAQAKPAATARPAPAAPKPPSQPPEPHG
jgi:hypothetical protein